MIGIRVRYERVSAPQLTFRVEVVGAEGSMAVGHVVLAANGRWTARTRNKPAYRAQGGFLRRSDAAAFCAIECGAAAVPIDRREAA